jgi:hypothetical protein
MHIFNKEKDIQSYPQTKETIAGKKKKKIAYIYMY